MSTVGHGLLSGQWGAGKTFVVFELAAALVTGQPFLGHAVKRQCGVLLIAAEGASEVRPRLDAVVRNKCGNMERAPFRWYETTPLLLQKGAVETLIAMARQADDSLQQEFGLPLGLVVIDTIAACAGYPRAGDENDFGSRPGRHECAEGDCRDARLFRARRRSLRQERGIRHPWLRRQGERQRSGTGLPRRQGAQWQRHEHKAGRAEEPGRPAGPGIPLRLARRGGSGAGRRRGADHHDGGGLAAEYARRNTRPEPDPWAECRRQDQRTAVLRLKRVLMDILADRGVDLPIPPDGPTVRMVDQEIVREQFYSHTPAEGTPKQKRQLRFLQFKRALGWAEDQQLIGIEEINDVTYLRLSRPDREGDEQC